MFNKNFVYYSAVTGTLMKTRKKITSNTLELFRKKIEKLPELGLGRSVNPGYKVLLKVKLVVLLLLV